MRTDFQAGDGVKLPDGAQAFVITKSSQHLTWVRRDSASEPEEYRDEKLQKVSDWDA
jgi:hypothetical protein